MEPKQQFSIWYFLVAFLLILALQDELGIGSDQRTPPAPRVALAAP